MTFPEIVVVCLLLGLLVFTWGFVGQVGVWKADLANFLFADDSTFSWWAIPALLLWIFLWIISIIGHILFLWMVSTEVRKYTRRRRF